MEQSESKFNSLLTVDLLQGGLAPPWTTSQSIGLYEETFTAARTLFLQSTWPQLGTCLLSHHPH